MSTTKMQNRLLTYIFSPTLLVTTLAVNAQQAPLGFSAKTMLTAGSDTNVFGLSENEQSANFVVLSPELTFVESYGKHKFSAKYEGYYTKYGTFESINYEDHKVRIDAKLEHTTRFKSEFKFQFDNVVELPGVNDALTQQLVDLNKYTIQDIEAKFTYGRNDAIGQAVVRISDGSRNFRNNEQDFRDHDVQRLVGTFFYRVAPNTRVLLETSVSDLQYDYNEFNSGSRYSNYLVGAEWQPSSITSGVIKIGMQEQNFDNANVSDISGLAFFVDIFWRPNTYSLLQFGASRTTRESSIQTAASFVATDFRINGRHELSPQVFLDLKYAYGSDDVVFGNDLTLKRHNIEASLVHKTSSWFDSQISVKHFSRLSEVDVYEVKSSQVMLGIVGLFGGNRNR